jgi:hypothetical protein
MPISTTSRMMLGLILFAQAAHRCLILFAQAAHRYLL